MAKAPRRDVIGRLTAEAGCRTELGRLMRQCVELGMAYCTSTVELCALLTGADMRSPVSATTSAVDQSSPAVVRTADQYFVVYM